jgi:hypothetical protein
MGVSAISRFPGIGSIIANETQWEHASVLAWVHEISTALKNPRVHVYYKA